MKAYQYISVIIPDRGFFDDPEMLKALNDMGVPEGPVPCPHCKKVGHALADGYKHKGDQPKGSNNQVILLEREVVFECEYPLRELGKEETLSNSTSSSPSSGKTATP